MKIDIQRPLMDGSADEYALAGFLLGARWKFPDGHVMKVESVRYAGTRVEGEQAYYPEIKLDFGPRFRVRSFLSRIDPSDIGDIEPVNEIAESVVAQL